jgi:hypothetical protein
MEVYLTGIGTRLIYVLWAMSKQTGEEPGLLLASCWMKAQAVPSSMPRLTSWHVGFMHVS